MEQIFVSSVQRELRAERQAVHECVHGNDLLRQFFRVFLFEDLTPADRKTGGVYLEQVKDSAIYELMGSSRQTASRDLDELVTKGLIQRVGEGRGTHYIKARGMPRK